MWGWRGIVVAAFFAAPWAWSQESRVSTTEDVGTVDRVIEEGIRRISQRLTATVLVPFDVRESFDFGPITVPLSGAPDDPELAEKWYESRAKGGKARAMVNLAGLLERREKDKVAPEVYVAWYKKAAAQDDAEAMANLGRIYLWGRDVKRDPKLAVEWIRKAVKKDNVMAILMLADCLRHGIGAKANVPEAIELLRDAASKKIASAMFELAVIYENGLGVPKDPVAAEEWYGRAKAGHSSEAFFNVAVRDIQSGDPAREKDGIATLNLAADDFYNIRAVMSLGYMYAEGRHVPRDLDHAKKRLEKFSPFFPEAAHYLGILHLRDTDDPKHNESALAIFKKSANTDDPIGLFLLGAMQFRGQGTTMNAEDAVRTFRLSAEKREIGAMAVLATAHALAVGVPRDDVEAYAWFGAAAAGGLQGAGDEFSDGFRRSASKAIFEKADRLKASYIKQYVTPKEAR